MAQQIEKEYVSTGKLKYIFMDNPLSFHKKAQKAHEAANCAGKQGKFWEMYDAIFTSKKLAPADLFQHAENLGLDKTDFNSCLNANTFASEIKGDIAEGQKAGVRGTPSFLVGWVKPGEDKVYAVKIIRGAKSFDSFKTEIDGLLEEGRKKAE